MPLAIISDPHGCVKEFNLLVSKLEWISLDEIWTVGDLVDRGSDSHGVIQTCIKKGIKSVKGNHEESICSHYRRVQKGGDLPFNESKRNTLAQLTEEDFNYIDNLPYIHVDDKLGLIIVHAGVWPNIPLYKQPTNVCRAQMIHPDIPGQTKWWNQPNEAQLYKEGWRRWISLYDYKEDIIFGHSTCAQPTTRQNLGMGKTIGIDTGSCFGGMVTACIYYDNKEYIYLAVKSEAIYTKDVKRSFWEP